MILTHISSHFMELHHQIQLQHMADSVVYKHYLLRYIRMVVHRLFIMHQQMQHISMVIAPLVMDYLIIPLHPYMYQ